MLMRNRFSSVLSKFFCNLFTLIAFALLYQNNTYASECILANDNGSTFSVTVNAKQDVVSNYEVYGQQKIAFTNTTLFTNGGSDGFYIEITGKWNPWGNLNSSIGSDYKKLLENMYSDGYCDVFSENFGSDEFNVSNGGLLGQSNGEANYINNSCQNPKEGCTVIKPKAKSCWLTGGQGLYIGFFGPDGNTPPQILTHLNAASVERKNVVHFYSSSNKRLYGSIIECAENNIHDDNGDGILTLNECYYLSSNRKVNAAYYTVGKARCDADYYHGNSDIDRINNKIGIFDCYSVEEGKKIDRTIFIYETKYFYQDRQMTKVKKNNKIKLAIYDQFYNDNVGAYTVKFYSGVNSGSDKGLIENIVYDLEKLFLGSKDENGNVTDGILYYFYNLIVLNTTFAWIVRMAAVLYITFLGFSFMMGTVEFHQRKHYMGALFKLALIFSITTPFGWQLYDRYFVRFFIDGLLGVVNMISDLSQSIFNPDISSGGFSFNAYSSSEKFAFIDNLIERFFSKNITIKIWSLFFYDFLGLFKILMLYYLIIYFIFSIINATFPYIIMLIQSVIALSLGPIFITFLLFEKTKNLFKNWLTFIGGRFLNMTFLFMMLFGFSSIITNQLIQLMSFEACRNGGILKILNFIGLYLEPWIANFPETYKFKSIPSFFIELFFIYFLIKIFINIVRKIPSIVDSMVVIDNTDAGFIGPNFASRVGSPFTNKSADPSVFIGGSISEALNTIDVYSKSNKKVGLYDYSKSASKSFLRALPGASAKVIDFFWKKKFNRTFKESSKATADNLANNLRGVRSKGFDAVMDMVEKSKYLPSRDTSKIINNIRANGLTGAEAINAANLNYKNYLKENNPNISESNRKRKLDEFNNRVKREFAYEVMQNEFKKISDHLSTFYGAYDSSMIDFVKQKYMRDYYSNVLKMDSLKDAAKIEDMIQFSYKINPIDGRDYKDIEKSINEAHEALIKNSKEVLNKSEQLKKELEELEKINKAKEEIKFLDEKRKAADLSEEEKKKLNERYELLEKKLKEESESSKDNKQRILDLSSEIEDLVKKMQSDISEANLTEFHDLMKELRIAERTTNEAKLDEQKQQILLSGIDSDSFAVQGIGKDFGLSNDLKDMLGITSGGAANVVLSVGDTSTDIATEEDQHKKVMEKIEEIQTKIKKQEISIQMYNAQKEDDQEKVSQLKGELDKLKKY